MTMQVNPYVAGNPLRGERGFFGRADTVKWVSQGLLNPTTNALVLFGQRRIGKTTLLLQLERILTGDDFFPIYFDLQDQATRPLGQVLVDLADIAAERAGLALPELEVSDDRGRSFQRDFLPRLYQGLKGECRPVFLLDEFDVLHQTTEEKLPTHVATRALFPFLRNLMVQEPRLAFVFAVGRRAEDLSVDFTAIFKGALSREIWVLDRESATSLILQAQTNGTLSYTDQAVDRTLGLTKGHPYMTQLLCQRIWERAHAEDPVAPPQIDVPDVEAAIPDVLEAGRSALHWLWRGLTPAERIYAAALAEAAGAEDEAISDDQVVQVLTKHAARLRSREVELAPRDLVRRRVLELSKEKEYRFAVELFRLWVRRYQPLRDVKEELDQAYPLAEEIFSLGLRIFHQGEWEVAARYFKEALEKNSHHFRARLYLGEAFLKLNRIDEAVGELKQAYELDQDETRLPLARALVAQAREREETEDEDGALAACAHALQISPHEETAQEIRQAIWERRGNAVMEQGDLDAALAAYQQAGAEDWESAVARVRHTLEGEPYLFRSRFYLGEILLKLDRAEEAKTELDTALAVYTQASFDHLEAIDFFQSLLEREPHNVFARLHLGELLRVKGQVNEAVEHLKRAYELDPAMVGSRLARALEAQAQAAKQANDRLAMLGSYAQVLQVDPSRRDILEVMERTIVELQQEETIVDSDDIKGTQKQSGQIYVAPRVDKGQLEKILGNAESQTRLLGVVALDPDWQTLARKWAGKLSDAPDFDVTILCESDNFLFSKSLTLDIDTAENRRSFRELKFIRDRAATELPDLLKEERVPDSLIGSEGRIRIEVTHLPLPVSVAKVDDRIFVNLWLHEVEGEYEEITRRHPWRSLLEKCVTTYFDPVRGRKYACQLGDELLELYDHKRIPRGIYPRKSFYDTDYSQLVIWAFIFDRQGRMLIHRRSDNAKDNRGMWDKSVGGHIEFSDYHTSRAAFREVIEELFIEEPEYVKSDLKKWAVSDKEVIYLGEWRPSQRRWHPFHEIRSFEREWAFFRLRESTPVYSPRTLPNGTERRLRVIPDIFLFVAGPQLTEEFLKRLKNSTFKLVELAELKNVMDRAMSGREVPGFDENRFGPTKPVPEFTPDLKNIMTGRLRDVLGEFSQYVKRYIKE